MTRKRCAIYTRKSTDEGLDLSFNSLDAQRGACQVRYCCTHKLNPNTLQIKQLRFLASLVFALRLFNLTKH